MKKHLPYILVIAALAVVAAWYVLTRTNGDVSLGEKAFAVENTSAINKIVLTNTDKKKIVLEKKNGVWIVNGKFTAREELLQGLMEAIKRVTVLAPVARAGHDNVIRQLMDYNVLVQVYTDKGDKAVKTYYVGGPTPDNEGTYMVLENNGKLSERPYITYIPGMHGYLSPRFNMKEEDWRSKLLFDYREGDIKSLSVEYPGDEKKSFTITSIAPDSFELQPKENKYTIKEPYRQQYIREYLRFYSGIYFEAFDNNLPTKDSVMHTTPYCVFTITGKDNSVNKASLFYMPISQRSKMQFDTKGNEMTYDVDHYYAAVNNNQDFTVVQYYVFGKLLREYKDFFFKPAANKH